MPIYLVIYEVSVSVEADNEEEAEKMAENLDLDCFEEMHLQHIVEI